MQEPVNTELTDRQRRELEYHREHAREYGRIVAAPSSWDVIDNPRRRWWNAYWAMYTYLMSCDLKDKSVLVVGCGFGDDALLLAKLGARVSAFDLSPDSLQCAKDWAAREGFQIEFDEMTAEKMRYADSSFDYIIARDILHHVDIPSTIKEIVRVASPGAMFVVNEIYSHSFTDRIRHSSFVVNFLYPHLSRLIYGPEKPYITEDERKLNEHDIREITKPLQPRHLDKHFDFLVNRLLPDRFAFLAKTDRFVLRVLKPIGSFLAGRVLFSARISK